MTTDARNTDLRNTAIVGNTVIVGNAALLLSQTRQLTSAAHRAAIDSLPARMRHMAGYHIGWWDADGNPADPVGKAIRPAFTLTCARAATANAAATDAAAANAAAANAAVERAVPAAVAVELVHDFSLLHDDVIDRDLTRRHQPAAWTVFGVGQAILVGDALLALAIEQLDDAAPMRVLAAAARELCAGQSADVAFEDRSSVDVAECLAMVEGKTGALLGAACQLGAMAAGLSASASVPYRLFGRELGMAFQLVDDLLGIWGEPSVTGKPAGSDLTSRKKSLPVVFALSTDTPAGRELAADYADDRAIDVARAAALVEQAGGRAWAQAEAGRRTTAALQALAAANPAPAAADDLRALAALITHRDS
jgi:geranylgeranyl diphosphate synthase, type I